MMLGQLIGKGRTASVYEFGDKKVIKLFNEDIHKSWIEHEYRINKIANEFNCSTPNVFEITEIDSKMGIVFEAIKGVTVTNLLSKKPLRTKHIAKEAALVHAGIHMANADNLENQVDYYSRRIKLTDMLSDVQKDKIIDYLKTLPNDNKLCHGDLHTENYLVKGENYYVIDWTNAYKGHPASDIARSMLMMNSPYGKTIIPLLLRPIAGISIKIYNKVFLDNYLDISFFGKEIIDAWRLPVAAARLIEKVPYERQWLMGIIEEDMKKIQCLIN